MKEKNIGIIVDQDGFQQVGNKKSTQKNIFKRKSSTKMHSRRRQASITVTTLSIHRGWEV